MMSRTYDFVSPLIICKKYTRVNIASDENGIQPTRIRPWVHLSFVKIRRGS